jgi:hypothetical protein
MQPQGAAVVNTAYIDQLTAEVNAISGNGACAELQAVVILSCSITIPPMI